jgi:MFS family permease
VPGTSFVADFRSVLAERDFRRLWAIRLISQAGDGVFTAGLSAYVFFNQATFPNPGAAAAAFAVLYLPYSLIGPFAGVFIDRWSRRQIMVWSALVRAIVVTLTASLVASGNLGVPLYAAVLAVLGVNRFFLSSLSAALPHVVAPRTLVMANSVAPTTGTIASFLGGLAGLGVHLATGSGRGGSAVTLLVGGACYVLASTVAVTIRRDLLGPPPMARGQRRAGVATELGVVARGLAAGARHVWSRRPAAAALGATASQRGMYGILLLTSILLYRNYFYAAAGANSSLAHFTLVVIASAVGYGTAAVVTPVATKRISKAAMIALMLVTGAVITGVLGPTFNQVAFLVIGFGLGVVAQSVAICATTILQEQMEDSYRGRVFALYDMLFNVPFVICAVAAAQVLPDTGKSYPLVIAAGGGYLAAGLVYLLVSRHELTPPPPPGGSLAGVGGPGASSPGTGSPSPSAQRRSS